MFKVISSINAAVTSKYWIIIKLKRKKKEKQTNKQTRTRFLPKIIYVVFKALCYCNFMQKKMPMHWFLTNKFFPPKKTIWFNFKTLCYCNFMQKSPEKFNALIFHDTWNFSFWAYFGPLLAEKSQNKVCYEKIHLGNF